MFFLGAETNPTIRGHAVPLLAGEQHEFVCFINNIWHDNMAFTWTVNNQTVQGHTSKTHKHENNTATFMSILIYNVTGMDLLDLTCSVASPNLKAMMKTSVSSVVYGKSIIKPCVLHVCVNVWTTKKHKCPFWIPMELLITIAWYPPYVATLRRECRLIHNLGFHL